MNKKINIHTFFVRILLMFGVYIFWCVGVFAEFKIIELMPNTTDDTNLEYISLKNISDVEQTLSGYILEDASGKQYIFGDEIFLREEEKVFFRSETKIILNNSNEELFLYNPEYVLEDSVTYSSSTKGEALFFVDDSETGAVIEPGILTLNISLQRPSYVDFDEEEKIFYCDTSKDECKINFNFEESFTSEFPEKDYECMIDFGLSFETGQEQKCNPNTIVFPKTVTSIHISILKKTNKEVIFEEKYQVIYDETESYTNQLTLLRPNIIVQSGLDGSGKYFYCQKLDCKINLEYKKRHLDEMCLWKFRKGIPSSPTTHTRCNPGYVTLPEGIHELSLQIYEKDNESNRKVFHFFVYNEASQYEIGAIQKEVVAWKRGEETGEISENISELSSHSGYLESSIILQGALSQGKTLSGNTLECLGVEKCYVNFDAEILQGGEDVSYIWKKDGEIFSQERNPKAFWLEGVGKYHIELITFTEGEQSVSQDFFVLISDEKTLTLLDEPLLFSEEKKEVEKTPSTSKIFTQNFLVLKYDGLRVSGKAPLGSRVEIYQEEQRVFVGMPDISGKYRFVSKNFQAGSYVFDTKIILRSGEEMLIDHSGETELTMGDRAFWFLPTKQKKVTVKQSNLTKNPQFIIKTGGQNTGNQNIETTETLSVGMKIFMSFVILLALSFGSLHLIFQEFSQIPQKSSLFLERVFFSTRSQISLILS